MDRELHDGRVLARPADDVQFIIFILLLLDRETLLDLYSGNECLRYKKPASYVPWEHWLS